MGWRQYRKIKPNEFIVIGYDMAMGGPDYSCAVFLSKTNLDIPLVFHERCIATEATNQIVPVIEKISDITGISPIIAPETNAGGIYEIERINALNRLNKFKMYKSKSVGSIDGGEATRYGFTTNTATRPKMLEDLKNAIDHRLIAIYDKPLINEMFSFIVSNLSTSWKARAEQNAHDDLCFVAGTKVLTDRGQVPIENIKVGDLVMTRQGYRNIVATSHRKANVISRIGLRGTPSHPIITKRGEIPLAMLNDSDRIYMWNEKLSCIEEKNIIDIRNQVEDISGHIIGDIASGRKHQLHFTGRFGLIILDLYQRVLLFITRMKTHLTTILQILKSWINLHICTITFLRQRDGRFPLLMEKSKLKDFLRNLLSGGKIIQRNIGLFVRRMEKDMLKKDQRPFAIGRKKIPTKHVMPVSLEDILKPRDLRGILKTGEKNIQTSGLSNREKMQNTYTEKHRLHNVLNVAKSLHIPESWVQSSVQTYAEQDTEEEVVYNLQVADTHEYFANNILVHNCMALAIAWQLYQTEEPHKLKVDFKDFSDDTKVFHKGFY